MLDGTLVPMKIQTVVEINDILGDDTLITFTTNLPVEVGGPDTSTIDWLLLARFATDTMSVSWETIEVAQIELPFQSLPYAESE